MTPIDRFERRLPDQLTELAAERNPDYLDDLFAQTSRTRQRPAWTFPERWLPMTIALRRPMLAPPMRLLALGLAFLLALLAALALAPILSSPTPLPAVVSQGVGNGLLAFGRSGDIWVAEAAPDGERRALIAGLTTDDYPDWSPDGKRIAFWRKVAVADRADAADTIMVADADGTNIRQLTTEPIVAPTLSVWSPDGSMMAIASSVRGVPAVTVFDVETGASRVLDVGYPADFPAWHPSGESLIVRGMTPDGAAIYTATKPVDPDPGGDWVIGGPIARSDTSAPLFASTRGRYDLMELNYSPDGSLITGITAYDNGDGRCGVYGCTDTRNFLMQADGSDMRVMEFDPASDYEDGGWFSPDGRRYSMIIRKGDLHQVAILTLDGSAPPVATESREDPDAMPAIWSPDGTQLLSIRIADGVSHLIDPNTGAETLLPWLGSWPDWQPLST